MKNRKIGTILMAIMIIVLLSLAGLAFAANDHQTRPAGAPMTPELTKKREMVRKQQEQRITPEKRKAAAETLKTERLKVYRAKQAVEQSAPTPIDTK